MGSPPPHSSLPGLGQGRRRWLSPGKLARASCKAASSRTQLGPSRSPSSPFGAALASVCVASASRGSLSASRHACFPVCSSSPSDRWQRVRKSQGGGGTPLGALDLEPGKWEP